MCNQTCYSVDTFTFLYMMMMMTMMTNIIPYWRTKTHIWDFVLMGFWASAILSIIIIIVIITILSIIVILLFIAILSTTIISSSSSSPSIMLLQLVTWVMILISFLSWEGRRYPWWVPEWRGEVPGDDQVDDYGGDDSDDCLWWLFVMIICQLRAQPCRKR